jgi:hypothetical protein
LAARLVSNEQRGPNVREVRPTELIVRASTAPPGGRR